MDERMFSCYLEYKKKNNASVWKVLKKFPIKVLAAFILLIASSFLSIVISLITDINYIAWIFAVIEIGSCIMLYYFTEDFQVKNSNASITEYREHCYSMIEWLKEQGYDSYDSINLLYNRLANRINVIEMEHSKRNEHVEKWIQVLAVPIVLAMFSSFISSQREVSEIISEIIPFGIICIIIYGLFWCFRTGSWFPEKRKLEQRKYFLHELQDILDIYMIEKEKEEKNTVKK